jgi:hypothetical protein
MQVDITLTMTKSEASNFVKKPINGQGGFQTLLKRVCQNYDPSTRTLRVSLSDAMKVKHYATKFGQGGFQDRLMPIVNACDEISRLMQEDE